MTSGSNEHYEGNKTAYYGRESGQKYTLEQ